LRYEIEEEDLKRLPMRIPMVIAVYSVAFANTTDIKDGVLRDERDVYFELKAEPLVPGLVADVHEFHLQRAQFVSLGALGVKLTHQRPVTMKLQCNGCTFADDHQLFHYAHVVSGSASVLTEHLRGLDIRVNCVTCVADSLRITAWDMDVGNQEPSEEAYPLGHYYGITRVSTDFKPTYSELSFTINVHTSVRARRLPVLSVLSEGFIAVSGITLHLGGVVALLPADLNEPLALRAVDGMVDAVVWCSIGEVAMDVAYLTGALDAQVPTACADTLDEANKLGIPVCDADGNYNI
jgi:hypothetical protein